MRAELSQPVALGLRSRLAAAGRRRVSFAGAGAALGTAATLLMFVLLIGLPLGLVLVQSVAPRLFDPSAPSAAFSAAPFLSAFADGRVRTAILHSLVLGAVAAVSATVLGALYAVMLRRTDVPLRGLLAATPWLVFLTPGYMKALAWVLLMSPNGYLAQFELVPAALGDAFFSIWGLVFVHTLTWFPLAYFIMSGALAGLGGEYEDAARVVGASAWTAWIRINLPLLLPAIMLSLVSVFADVLADFGMASTIARTVDFGLLTYGIYTATNDYPVNFALAGVQAALLLAMVALALLADRLLRRRTSLRLISGRSRPARFHRLGGWRWAVAGMGVLVGLLAVILPLVALALRALSRTLGQGLVARNMTLRWVEEALSFDQPSNQALLRSLEFASLTALIATGVAVLLACWLERGRGLLRGAVLATTIGSIAVPGIVLGLGYILMWNQLPGFRDLPGLAYGSWPLLVLGYAATAIPYAVVIVLVAVGQLSPGLFEAARLHGAGPVHRLLRITVPLISVSLLGATLFVFLRTMFELPMSRLLIPADGPPAPALIVRLFGNDDDGIGSALSFLAMAASGAVAAAVWYGARRLTGRSTRWGLDDLVGLPRA